MRTANKIMPAAGTVAGKHRMRRRRLWIAVLASLLVAAGGPVGPVEATSPGRNGLLVFVRASDLYTMDPVTGVVVDRLTTSGNSYNPQWSPDGTRIAFTRQRRLHVMNADGSGVRRIFTRRHSVDPTWSPDGAWLAFTSIASDFSREIFKVRTDGTGGLVQLTNGQRPTGPECFSDSPSWSPTSPLIAFDQRCGVGTTPSIGRIRISVVNADTGAVRVVTHVPDSTLIDPNWRPDGRSLLFATSCTAPGPLQDCFQETEIARVNLDGSGFVILTETGRTARYPAPSPDGSTFAYALYLDGVPTVQLENNTGLGVLGTAVDWQPLR